MTCSWKMTHFCWVSGAVLFFSEYIHQYIVETSMHFNCSHLVLHTSMKLHTNGNAKLASSFMPSKFFFFVFFWEFKDSFGSQYFNTTLCFSSKKGSQCFGFNFNVSMLPFICLLPSCLKSNMFICTVLEQWTSEWAHILYLYCSVEKL